MQKCIDKSLGLFLKNIQISIIRPKIEQMYLCALPAPVLLPIPAGSVPLPEPPAPTGYFGKLDSNSASGSRSFLIFCGCNMVPVR